MTNREFNMKHIHTTFLFLIFSLTTQSETNQTLPNIQVNPNFNNNNTTNINIEFSFEIICNLINHAINAACSQAVAFRDHIHGLTQSFLEQQKNSAHVCYQWIKNNKLKTTRWALTSCYLYYNLKLFLLKKSLQKKDLWSLWNNTIPTIKLIEMDQKQLAKMLINEIQRRKACSESPENFTQPLTDFLQEIENEKKTITHYLTICNWIRRLKLNKIMWYNETLLIECIERLQRITYLKTIFTNWITEYKIKKNNS